MSDTSIKGKLLEVVTNISPDLGNCLDYGLELAPYIGPILQYRKFNRLEGRLVEHEEQLKRIGQLIRDEIVSSQFIQEKVAPIVFSDLLEEHEDSKIRYILNGFENIFIEENTNESIIINHYDTLRSLRYADVKRLLYFAEHTDITYPEYPFESEEFSMLRSIDRKLERLELIIPINNWVNQSGVEYQMDIKSARVKFYGEKFLEFILLDFQLEQRRKNSKFTGDLAAVKKPSQ